MYSLRVVLDAGKTGGATFNDFICQMPFCHRRSTEARCTCAIEKRASPRRQPCFAMAVVGAYFDHPAQFSLLPSNPAYKKDGSG